MRESPWAYLTLHLRAEVGRVALELGDVELARRYFPEATNAPEFPKAEAEKCAGLLALADGKFQDAATLFSKARALDPSSAAAGNNEAICRLYGGSLSAAAGKLEQCLKVGAAAPPSGADPAARPPVDSTSLFNLCTLYAANCLCPSSRAVIPSALQSG